MDLFMQWIRKHSTPGTKCDFCDLIHNDYKEYSLHLEVAHPEKHEEFLAHYQLNGRSVPQGTARG